MISYSLGFNPTPDKSREKQKKKKLTADLKTTGALGSDIISA